MVVNTVCDTVLYLAVGTTSDSTFSAVLELFINHAMPSAMRPAK